MSSIVATDSDSSKLRLLPDAGQSGEQSRAGRQQRSALSLRALLRLLIVSVLAALLLQAAWRPPPAALDLAILDATRGQRFDLVAWEVDAIAGKLGDGVRNPAAGLDEEQATQMVREHLRLAQRADQLEREIERIYADPAVAGAATASAAQRQELAAIREQLNAEASTVEAILERQLTEIIQSEGLTTAGLVWPPVRVRFSEPPQMLVVSPRDRIQRLRSVDLLPDLDSAGRTALEQTIAQEENLSTYVTGIGGYGVYPTMVIDRYGLPWTAETVAHEWIHNYLAFRPLGWSFLDGGESVVINETVASIAGEELGRTLLARYYPDLLPPPPAPLQTPEEIDEQFDEPPGFEFGPQMRATRLVVDALLEEGYVEEAEAFMEARRRTFADNGYLLRVLNQAYFAFHGSYATGAAASDPIGPKLTRLRELSPSLQAFMQTVSRLTNAAELDAILAQMESTVPSPPASP
jgi:hypothetical protein